MPTALLRSIPDSFTHAITGPRGRAPDVEEARIQHARYRDHLEASGYEIEVLDADESHPDCVFIEHTSVILGSIALITRPGAESRRGETPPVARFLSARFELVTMEAPGTLDGGDVMVIGDTVWIGLSTRTNQEGARQLAAVATGQGLRTMEVPVTGALHLKSAVSPVGDDAVVVTPGTVDQGLLAGLDLIAEAESERHRFSALPLHSGAVMVTEGTPETTALVAQLGREVVAIDVSEIQAADGGLTCMSILF